MAFSLYHNNQTGSLRGENGRPMNVIAEEEDYIRSQNRKLEAQRTERAMESLGVGKPKTGAPGSGGMGIAARIQAEQDAGQAYDQRNRAFASQMQDAEHARRSTDARLQMQQNLNGALVSGMGGGGGISGGMNFGGGYQAPMQAPTAPKLVAGKAPTLATGGGLFSGMSNFNQGMTNLANQTLANRTAQANFKGDLSAFNAGMEGDHASRDWYDANTRRQASDANILSSRIRDIGSLNKLFD